MNGAKGIGNMPGRYGDWVTPGRVNKVCKGVAALRPHSGRLTMTNHKIMMCRQVSVHYTAGFSYISNLFEGVELATALGKTENATYLKGMATKLAAGFQAAWYNPTAHTFADGRQTSYALALSLPGVVPTADYDKVVQGLYVKGVYVCVCVGWRLPCQLTHHAFTWTWHHIPPTA